MPTLDLSAPDCDITPQRGDYGYTFTVATTAVSGLTVTGTVTGPDGTAAALTVSNAGSGTTYTLTVTAPAAVGDLEAGLYEFALVGVKTNVRTTLLTGRWVVA